jgi:MFS family permease
VIDAVERVRLVQRNTVRLSAAQGFIQMASPVLLVVGGVAAGEITGDDGAAGMIWFLYFLAAAGGAVAIGRWMDRVGRRPGLMLAYALAGLAGIGCALAIAAGSYAGLLACAIPFGVASGGANLARGAVADMYPADRRARAVGWLLAAGTIGAIGSPLLAAFLQGVARDRGLDPYVLPWVIVPLGALAALMCVFATRPDPRDLAVPAPPDVAAAASVARGPAELLRVPAIRTAILAIAAGQMTMVGVMGVTPSAMHALGHTDAAISFVITFHITGMFALAPILGRWIDRVGRRAGLIAGCAASIVGALLSSTESSSAVFGVGLLVIGLGWSMTFLAATAVISDLTAPTERAGALGVTDVFIAACSALAGLAGGLLLTAFGFRVVGITLAALLGAVLLAVTRLREPAAVASRA